MLILAIESSCDETAASVVADGLFPLSNIISSQTDFHRKYGGIVPEIAARKHIESISTIVEESLIAAKKTFADIDAIAVTFGPGLAGSLIVGLSFAKALSYSLKKPLIGVNHLEGHIYAGFLPSPTPAQAGVPPLPLGEGLPARQRQSVAMAGGGVRVAFPFLSLIVSGGHTQLVLVKGHCEYETLGRTRDDAAGEAYDKVARFLGLGYPGGPIIDKLAKEGNPSAVDFRRPMQGDGYDFSFSGIKTGVVYFTKKNPDWENTITKADMAASFQRAVVESLVSKTMQAAKNFGVKTISLGGGVAANSELRETLLKECEANGFKALIPPLLLCTDNAAMIGCAAYFRFQKGYTSNYDLGMDSVAKL